MRVLAPIRRRLALKITIALVAVLLFGFGAVILAQVAGEQGRLRATFDRGVTKVTRLFATSARNGVRFHRTRPVERTYEALDRAAGRELDRLVVYTAGGSVLKAFGRPEVPGLGALDVDRVLASGDMVRRVTDDHTLLVVPVKVGGEVAGAVAAAWSHERLHAEVVRATWIQGAIALAATILLVALLGLLLRGLVVRPVRRLQAAMTSDLQGEAVTFAVNRHDEIGDMVAALNARESALVRARRDADAARHELYRVIERLPLPMMLLEGPEGHFALINRKFREALGYTDVELKTIDDWWQRAYPDPAYRHEVRAAWDAAVARAMAAGGEITPAEAWVTTNHGETRFFQFYGAAVGDRLTVVLVDLTALRTTEARLKEATRQAEAASAAKSEFLAKMSHEIRTPMNAVLGMTHLARRADPSPRQQDYLAKIESSAQGLLGIINDILDFSRMDAGRLELAAAPFDPDAVLDDVANVVTPRAEEKGLAFVLARDPDVPRRLTGDALRLRQVLTNLATNAVKFTETGGVVLRVEPGPAAADTASVTFSVTDTGPGMGADEQARVFDAFSQGDGSVTREHGGTGLGLAICHQLVSLMGGTIAVDSEPGHGSTFRFTVALGAADPGPGTLRDVVPDAVRGRRVLVADGDAAVRDALCALLEANGLAVATAADADHARHALENGAPDAALLAPGVAGTDGVTTARRAARAAVALLATAPERERLAADGLPEEPDAWLLKPVGGPVLMDTVTGLLGGVPPCGTTRQVPAPAALSAPAGGGRVLLAEDNALNQEVAAAMLADAGLAVTVAETGHEVLDHLEAAAFDLVLLDIQMPGMDGLTTARHIRADPRFRDLPVIAMTAHAMAGDREKSLEAGMDDHLVKPVDPEGLDAVLARWLGAGGGATADAEAAGVAPDLAAVPGLDAAGAVRRVGGDPDRLRRFLHDFRDSHRDLADRVDAALRDGRPADAGYAAHTAKAAAGSVGLTRVADAAAALDAAVKADDGAAAERAAGDLRAALDAALAALDALEPEALVAARTDTTEPLATLLERAEARAAEGNLAAEDDLAALAARLAGTDHADLVHRAREAFDDLETDTAAGALARLRDALADT